MENKILPVFTAEDFKEAKYSDPRSADETAADIANAKLEKLLGPVVYE